MESTAEARPAEAGKKRKGADASEGDGTWTRKRNNAMVHLVGLLANKMKEAVASESGADGALNKEEEGDGLFKEGEMLNLREELWEAEGLWRQKRVPGALAGWLKRKKTTQVPAVSAKKKKVVRVILHEAFINCIITNPDLMGELSDEEIAKRPKESHQKYAIVKLINAKNRAYHQAIIDQYRAFGFAYDEKEVSDEEDEAVVVKN